MRALALVALVGCASVPFDRRDWAVQGSLAVLTAADMVQTRTIVRHGMEGNPLIGDHGQRIPYFVVLPLEVVLELAVARAMPPDYRVVYESAAMGSEAYCIYYNYLGGVAPW